MKKVEGKPGENSEESDKKKQTKQLGTQKAGFM